MRKRLKLLSIVIMLSGGMTARAQSTVTKPDTLSYKSFIWESEVPADCPFEPSEVLAGIRFSGLKSGFRYGDTWYPSWASNDTLYSPYTDGGAQRPDGYFESSGSWGSQTHNTTGHGIMVGDDPLTLQAYGIGTYQAGANPYHGRYPCGSLVYNGVWYYGTYCLDPTHAAQYGDLTINWPWLGPFVGFRYSTDYGRRWKKCPHTPENPLFGETGINGYPVKIGSPHFVDFGKNMEHSPDGKAYIVAHGADTTDTKWRFWNASWITGDQVYLLRVTPSIENMNDPSEYEFYSGIDQEGNPVWTNDFEQIKPLLEWNNNMGCVTVTYNPPLKKYLMCITDGGNTASKMNTYILESDKLTGDWRMVTYMKDFGEQAYFVNIPSKFISKDGKSAWLLYSGNFAPDWNGEKIQYNPPGSHYGLVFQKIEFLDGNSKGKNSSKKWYKGNTHTHTTVSDGNAPPGYVVNWYHEQGYNFLVLSDHNIFVDPDTIPMPENRRKDFILIGGEELTARVHSTGLNIDGYVHPGPDLNSKAEVMQSHVDSLQAADGLCILNHANLSGVEAEDMVSVENLHMLEIYNGYPDSNNFGSPGVTSVEAKWDSLLTWGKRFYGVASDDTHNYEEFYDRKANPGRGWVMVRSDELNGDAIAAAMQEGDFYSSIGVILKTIEVNNGMYTVEIDLEATKNELRSPYLAGHFVKEENPGYRIEFIGTGGKILQSTEGTSASFDLRSVKGYIRARAIYCRKRSENHYERILAWTQPVFLK